MRNRVGINRLARRKFDAIQSPGPPEVPPQIPARQLEAHQREVRTLWPNMMPAYGHPYDWRNSIVGVGAGQTILLAYRMPGAMDGVLKTYGVGFLATSLIPAPGAVWTYELRVNQVNVTPTEGFGGYFTIPCPNATDGELLNLTFRVQGDELIELVVNNGTGINLDLWGRVKGWTYDAPAMAEARL